VWAVGYQSYDNNTAEHTLVLHWNGNVWSMVPSPNLGIGSYLYGVAAISASDAWAVGRYDNGGIYHSLILHWNGNAWSMVPSPDLGTSSNYLNAVAAVSPEHVWAVGSYRNNNVNQTLTEQWDGSVWAVVSSPNLATGGILNAVAVAAAPANDLWAAGTSYDYAADSTRGLTLHWDGNVWSVVPSSDSSGGGSELLSVAARSSDDVWAVGYFGSYDYWGRTRIEHWDGTSWSVKYSPNVDTPQNYLYGITAVSPGDAWAVGYSGNVGSQRTLMEQWNGDGWLIVASPNQGPNDNRPDAVAATSANDVWAVGDYRTVSGNTDVYQTLILHWDGSAWTIVPSPNPSTAENHLLGIAAISPTDAWAVGITTDAGGIWQTLIEHWDGTAWGVVPSPDPGTNANALYGITPVSPNDAWAVGFYANGYTGRNLTLHWDGNVWSVVPSPNQGTHSNGLLGVSAASSNDVWAVGYYHTDNGSFHQPLVEHWDGSAWTIVPSPALGLDFSQLEGVAAVSANDVWAVGVDRGQTLIERYNPCATSCPVHFADLPNPSTYYQYIECLACREIVSGYACGGSGEPCNPGHDPYFRPNANITRGQLAKIIALSAQIANPVSGQAFQDVPVGSTFYTYTGQLTALGVMSGYPCGGAGQPCVPPANLPYFRPNANATRGQISKIDANAAGFDDTPSGQKFEDVAVGSTYYTYTYRLVSRGVMAGYPCGGAGEPCVPPGNLPYFRPNHNATRGQTSKIVSNTFFPNCQVP
jgi:hypothetical protein